MHMHRRYTGAMMANRGGPFDMVRIDGYLVRSLRKQRRLTQGALAARATEVSRGYIATIEAGADVSVRRPLAERLAAALGVDLDELFANPAGRSSPARAVLDSPLSRQRPIGAVLAELQTVLHRAASLVSEAAAIVDDGRER